MARKAGRNGDATNRNGSNRGEIEASSVEETDGPARTVTEEASDAIREAIQQLRQCTRQVREMLSNAKGGGSKYDERLSSHLSWSTKNMAAILDSMRKQENAARRKLEGMGQPEELEIVKGWYEEAAEEIRAELRAFVAQENRGILS